MKRLNPNTNKLFKRGDVREDGYCFDKYNLSAKVKKDGFYQENWLRPEVFNKESKNALVRTAKWYELNTERQNKNSAKWRRENNAKSRELVSKWFAKNLDKRAAYQAKRRAAEIERTPPWLTQAHLDEIADLYLIAKMFQMYTGQTYHVDHIEPLQGEDVCGLHVPWNLQVLHYKENLQKSNKTT